MRCWKCSTKAQSLISLREQVSGEALDRGIGFLTEAESINLLGSGAPSGDGLPSL